MRRSRVRSPSAPPLPPGSVPIKSFGRFRFAPTATEFIAGVAAINTALYQLPLLSFAIRHLDLKTGRGILTLATVPVAVFLESALLLLGVALVSQRILRPLCMLLALGNAVALYFLLTYGVVLDDTMMGNVLNTDSAEVTEYLHPALITYVLALGALPCWVLTRVCIQRSARVRILAAAAGVVLLGLLWAYATASSWLWIDQNSKRLGGMILPWSYVINVARHELPRIVSVGPAQPLPPATFEPADRTVVVLVIGEAARARNFELYGYPRATNPLLRQAGGVVLAHTRACATYTTAAVRCILSGVDSEATFSRAPEPLPVYLQRNGVDVIWRTRNFGEPPMDLGTYQKAGDLALGCSGPGCQHDEVLLTGLEQRIASSPSPRIFVVLHQSGSHGPAYYTKYPSGFERFTPVCKSVELSQCSPQALVNAYDNTILYEDYFLTQVIRLLQDLKQTRTLLIYMSDHGESLGEYGLYLHGVPYSLAPDVQKDIPFILWMSAAFIHGKAVDVHALAAQGSHSQRDVFHSVMGAFLMHGAAYLPRYDVFSAAYGTP